MNTVWTNGRVALTHDFIFGVSVKTEDGWIPFSSLDPEDQDIVRRLVDNNPSCPWQLGINAEQLAKREREAAELCSSTI